MSITRTDSKFSGLKSFESLPLLDRAMQCLAVLVWLVIPLGMVPSSLLVVYAALTWSWPKYLILFYYTWVYFLDFESPYNGGWKSLTFERLFKSWSLWNNYKDYFDAELIKEEELDPRQNYILGYHPHGVYCLSVISNLFLYGTRPPPFLGHRIRVSTLPVNFNIPIWREFLLAIGSTTCVRTSLINALKNPGTCVLIAIGGAEEFKYMEENCMDLVIQKRKGFAKLALETGCPLVPIIGFGENELFSRVKSPFLEKLNQFTEQTGRFAAPLFVGRSGTWMPKRSRLVTVVGKPIVVTKVENPTSEQILELHARYLESLHSLYDRYKDTYHKDRKRDLTFVQ